jgi:mitochondrial pyruvate carrier 2
MMKWSLVIAGIADLKKPAEDISTAQTSALTATGLIWARFVKLKLTFSRYSTQIIPVNWTLFSVNIFVALTGGYSLARKVNWMMSKKE